MKKGFTLIELIVVIVILGMIALVVYPSIIKVMNDAKEDAYNTQVKTIVNAAKEWAVKNPTSLPNTVENNYVRKKVSELISEGYITETVNENSEDVIKNPKNQKENMNGCVEIKYQSKQYTYTYIETC